MKKQRFLAILSAVIFALPLYCQDFDDDFDDVDGRYETSWMQCNYMHFKSGSGCSLQFVNSERDNPNVQLINGTFKEPIASNDVIKYKLLQSVTLGSGNSAEFVDCVKNDLFYLNSGLGTSLTLKQGAECGTLYIELLSGSHLSLKGKSKIGTLVLEIGSGCSIKLNRIEADTLLILGTAVASDIKLSGKIGTMIYCKHYNSTIAGRYTVNTVMNDDNICSKIEREARNLKKSICR